MYRIRRITCVNIRDKEFFTTYDKFLIRFYLFPCADNFNLKYSHIVIPRMGYTINSTCVVAAKCIHYGIYVLIN